MCSSIDDFKEILTQILTDTKFQLEVIKKGTKFTENYLSNIGTASENLLRFLESTDTINDKNSLKP